MKKEEKTLHDHYAVIERLFWIGFVIMLIPTLFQNDLWTWILMLLGFGIVVAACIYQNKHFKCPHCDSKLDPRRKVPNYCPNCGKSLYEE